MSSTGPGNRAVLTHAGTLPAAGPDVTYTKAKSLLSQSQGRRQALSSVKNNACPGAIRSEKQSSVDCRASPKKAVSSDGAKLQGAEMHCTTKQSCLSELTPEVVMPKEVVQIPEEGAANVSIEFMHLKLDCSDEFYKLSEGESLAVADDTPEEDVLFSQLAAGLEDKADGLPAWPELEPCGPQCSTPDWREPTPELAVPELEDEDSDPADLSDIETMHPCSDDEHLYELPEEFQLDDKLLDVLRDVRGVGWHQKQGVPVRMPSTPPEFAPLPALEVGCLHEEFLDLDALDKPIPEDALQFVPLD
ncbi:uncharacterized protein LOC144132657 [Amblyomma americanum]